MRSHKFRFARMPHLSPVKLTADSLKKVGAASQWLMSSLGFAPSTEQSPTAVVQPGESPGIENMEGVDVAPAPDAVRIQWCDYSEEKLEWHEGELDAFCASRRPAWAGHRWVNVTGLHPYAVNQLRQKYQFHTLAAEDVMRTSQRPKTEVFDHYIFTVVRMMRMEGEQLVQEQVSMFLFEKTTITFQELPGDVWGPIRERLNRGGARLRTYPISYLFYAQLDAVVDDLYMSAVGNRMNEIMKVLTIMASFFIPITFVAGVYGMNFEHIPELGWHYSYYVFWGVCISIVSGLGIYFWRRGWIGKR